MSDNQFEIDKICYEKNYLQVRDLIQIVWPMIAMTLTGGLWFGAYSLGVDTIEKVADFALCAIGNIFMIGSVFRMRNSMEIHLEKIKEISLVKSRLL